MELLPNRSISSRIDGQDRIGRGLPSGPIQKWGDESIQIVGARTMLTSMIIWINEAKLRSRVSSLCLWCKWPHEIRARLSGWWGEQNCTTFYTEREPPRRTHSTLLQVDKPVMAESCWELNVNKCSCAVSNSQAVCAGLQLADGQDPPPATTTANQFAPRGDGREQNEWFRGTLDSKVNMDGQKNLLAELAGTVCAQRIMQRARG